MPRCKSIGCDHEVTADEDFCFTCLMGTDDTDDAPVHRAGSPRTRMAALYPKYFKDVSTLDEIDVYAVHLLFNIQDPSGAIQHASKKLLLSGVRTGGKSAHDDIREARDTLNRWLELHELVSA